MKHGGVMASLVIWVFLITILIGVIKLSIFIITRYIAYASSPSCVDKVDCSPSLGERCQCD